jgi:hypothetical protein
VSRTAPVELKRARRREQQEVDATAMMSPRYSPTQDGVPRSPGAFGARLRAGPGRRALGGLSKRAAREMASKARAAGCDKQGGEQCGLVGAG